MDTQLREIKQNAIAELMKISPTDGEVIETKNAFIIEITCRTPTNEKLQKYNNLICDIDSKLSPYMPYRKITQIKTDAEYSIKLQAYMNNLEFSNTCLKTSNPKTIYDMSGLMIIAIALTTYSVTELLLDRIIKK